MTHLSAFAAQGPASSALVCVQFLLRFSEIDITFRIQREVRDELGRVLVFIAVQGGVERAWRCGDGYGDWAPSPRPGGFMSFPHGMNV